MRYFFLAWFFVFTNQSLLASTSITSTNPATGTSGVSVHLQSYYAKFNVPFDYVPNSPTTLVRFQNASSGLLYYEVQISTNLSFTSGNVDIPIPGQLPDNTTIQVVFSTLDLNIQSGTPNIFTFTTQDIAPFVKSIAPSTEIGLRDTTKTFTLTFSENITKGTGNILFTNKAGTVLHTIGIGTTAVTVIQNKAFVKVPSNWTLGTQFTVSSPASGFKDATNKNSVAYTSPLYSVYDPAATLQKIGQSPASTDTIASTATTIKIIFNKPVLLSTAASGGGSPDIIVQNGNGGPSITKTFGTMGAVFSGNELTLTFSGGYWPYTGTNNIRLAQSSVKDAAGNVLTSEVIASFYVKCVVAPPTPAPLVGDTNTCANVMTTLTTSNISGVTYDWISSGAAYTPTSGNSYSFYYPNAGSYTISVATRQGPCFSSRMYKTIKVKTPITVAAGITGPIQVTVGSSGNNYYLNTTTNEANNIDSTKWYQDGVYKGTNFNNYFTWNTVGTKEVKVVLKNKCGSIEKTLSVNVVSSDVTAPTISTLAPLNNATAVAVGGNLVATFNEPVLVGTGTISILQLAGGTLATYTLPSANVTVSGSTLTINPSTDLAAGTGYYVTISSGAIKDVAGNSFVGFSTSSAWSFTTASGGDVTAPVLVQVSPAQSATGVTVSGNLLATFSEPIVVGTGSISIMTSSGGTFASYTLPSANVTVSGSTLTINPSSDLASNTSYYVNISSGAVKDVAGNSFVGISNSSTWSFTTATTSDVTPPTVSGTNPANGATNVDPFVNMTLTFSEPIVKVAAKMVQLVKFTGDVVVGNYTTDSPEVAISGSTLTINPSFDLEGNTKYYIYIASGAVKDVAGNNFAGMLNSSTWSFTTVADVTGPVVTNLSPATNATNVAIGSNLILTASEPLVKVTGKMIQLVKLSGDIVVGNYTTDSPEVTFSGNTMSINPSFDLELGTTYYIYISNGFAKDAAGNFLTGTSTSSSYWRFTTTSITGVDEEMNSSNISVWPNPVQHEFMIQAEGFVSAELYDLAGVQVAKANSAKMNIFELASGIYILNVRTSSGNFKKQIVKN